MNLLWEMILEKFEILTKGLGCCSLKIFDSAQLRLVQQAADREENWLPTYLRLHFFILEGVESSERVSLKPTVAKRFLY